MGTKYSSVSVSGYNDTPPSDAGAQTAENQVTWSKHETKLSGPLNTAIIAINAALVTHFNAGPDAKTTTYTTVAGDHGKLLECSGTFTLSLLDAATATAGYWLIVKNTGVGTITVDTDTGGDQIDGSASVALAANEVAWVMVASTANAYWRLNP